MDNELLDVEVSEDAIQAEKNPDENLESSAIEKQDKSLEQIGADLMAERNEMLEKEIAERDAAVEKGGNKEDINLEIIERDAKRLKKIHRVLEVGLDELEAEKEAKKNRQHQIAYNFYPTEDGIALPRDVYGPYFAIEENLKEVARETKGLSDEQLEAWKDKQREQYPNSIWTDFEKTYQEKRCDVNKRLDILYKEEKVPVKPADYTEWANKKMRHDPELIKLSEENEALAAEVKGLSARINQVMKMVDELLTVKHTDQNEYREIMSRKTTIENLTTDKERKEKELEKTKTMLADMTEEKLAEDLQKVEKRKSAKLAEKTSAARTEFEKAAKQYDAIVEGLSTLMKAEITSEADLEKQYESLKGKVDAKKTTWSDQLTAEQAKKKTIGLFGGPDQVKIGVYQENIKKLDEALESLQYIHDSKKKEIGWINDEYEGENGEKSTVVYRFNSERESLKGRIPHETARVSDLEKRITEATTKLRDFELESLRDKAIRRASLPKLRARTE